MDGNVVETLIGAVVLVVAALFLAFAYTTSGVSSVSGYDLMAKFSSADGLGIGSDVRVSGIKVGTVVGQSLDPKTYQAVVQFSVAPQVKLPTDSSAKITSSGLLGSNYLSIEPGGSDKMLTPGGVIRYTQGSVNLLDLIGQAIFSAASKGGQTPAAPASALPASAASPAPAVPSAPAAPAKP